MKHRVGEGSATEIWLAEHVHLLMEVAVKVLKPGLVGDVALAGEVLEQFRFEAQVAAKLGQKTQHVVAVFDAGRGEQGPYLVMELVRGRTLREVLQQRGTMAPEAFALVLEALADALSPAHAEGIVHRNLKPSNVLFSDELDGGGGVKVADFGVARGQAPGSLRDVPTRPMAEVISSPEHMSPEQLRCEPLDGRSDVWALGVLAYEALTGQTPFAAPSMQELLVKVMLEPFAPVSSVREGVPRALDAWFAKALAKEAGDRFDSVRELCDAYLGALGLAPSLPARGGGGSMASIDLDSRATIPLLEGPDSARRAPVRDRAAITDAIQPGELQSRARRAARWGLAAVVIAVIATAGMAVLAIVAMTRAEEWRAMLRGALPADPVVTPRGPASADSPGVAGDLTSAAGGGVAKEAAEVAPGPSTTAPPPAASAPGAPRGRPRGRNPSDPSATF